MLGEYKKPRARNLGGASLGRIPPKSGQPADAVNVQALSDFARFADTKNPAPAGRAGLTVWSSLSGLEKATAIRLTPSTRRRAAEREFSRPPPIADVGPRALDRRADVQPGG